MRVEVGVEPGEEAPAAEEGPSPRDDRELAAMLGSRLDSLARAGLFSGAVLVAKDGVPLFRSAAGPADRAAGRANRPDTKFNLGSINKIFTKIAVAQLAQAGRLRLTDTIDRYLPDYPRGAASRITIQHLLEHRGGVADFFGPRYEAADRSKLRRVSDWLPLFRDEPLHFEPGTRQEYSNGGYVLLGAIVERVSGQDYYDYVREHIYHPAGMKDTDHYSAEDAVENLARGFTRRAEGPDAGDGSGLRDNASARPWRGSPAGGGYSTVDDLLRFVQALRGRALLDSTWSAWAGGGGIGIAGGAPGINATLEAEGPYVIAVMANLDPPAAERLAGTIRRWLPEGAGHERRSP
jgi:CubicO group peptidase (beta-lactamase class C family)